MERPPAAKGRKSPQRKCPGFGTAARAGFRAGRTQHQLGGAKEPSA
jgi:hypothetical protein